MRNRNLLFYNNDLSTQLNSRQQKVAGCIEAIPKDKFLVSSNEELASYVLAQLEVDPIVLHEDKKTITQSETEIDVSGDPSRDIWNERSGPILIKGTKIVITIPFQGENWLFRCKPNRWGLVFPTGDVIGQNLRLSISLPYDTNRETFKTNYEREIAAVRSYVDDSYNQVLAYNQSLPNLIEQAANDRRTRLSRHDNIAALLDIPIAERPDAPTITPVRLDVRKTPTLPNPPKTGLQPEPGITDETFDIILGFIRHQGRTFERTPKTYAVHGEEDLRDFILAHLNGHFEGSATGEAFRRKGKTDICIEQESRAAFVGECKIWTGPAGVSEALDQLLGYLTWRDSKSALVMFNTKNKDFSKILEILPGALRSHKLFVKELECSEAGEWRFLMRSEEDEGRRVTIQVFAFNLYQATNPRVRQL